LWIAVDKASGAMDATHGEELRREDKEWKHPTRETANGQQVQRGTCDLRNAMRSAMYHTISRWPSYHRCGEQGEYPFHAISYSLE